MGLLVEIKFVFWFITVLTLHRIPDLVFEVTAFTCALVKTYQHVKEISPASKLGLRKPLGQRLLEAMFRDSLLYFIW
jgi:hypothetical protein